MRPTEPKRARLLVTCALLLALAGCAKALREPPALDVLIGDGGDSGETARLIQEAERQWAERTLESVRRAAELFQEAAGTESARMAGLLGAVRARLWLGDHEEDGETRRAEAEQAVYLAQWCVRVEPDRIECDYYLALSVGLQARERRSTGIDALPIIVELLERVIERDPTLDHAGPHRVLALLYLRAPGWPTGPGDPDRGLEEAVNAVNIEAGFPPNQLALAEAWEALEETKNARSACTLAETQATRMLAEKVPDATEWLDKARECRGRAAKP